jgi:hypothetical protein
VPGATTWPGATARETTTPSNGARIVASASWRRASASSLRALASAAVALARAAAVREFGAGPVHFVERRHPPARATPDPVIAIHPGAGAIEIGLGGGERAFCRGARGFGAGQRGFERRGVEHGNRLAGANHAVARPQQAVHDATLGRAQAHFVFGVERAGGAHHRVRLPRSSGTL